MCCCGAGGDVNAANAWIYKNGGLPDVTCQQYQATNMECSAINTCMNCDHDPDVGCSAVENYPMITLSEFGTAHGDDEIMAEIYARGPVASNIDATCLADYKGGINMYDTCNTVLVNHVIELNGWGTEVRRVGLTSDSRLTFLLSYDQAANAVTILL